MLVTPEGSWSSLRWVCLTTVGDRLLVSAMPNLLNQLPLSLRFNNSLNSFNNGLKPLFQAVLHVLISIVILVYYFTIFTIFTDFIFYLAHFIIS